MRKASRVFSLTDRQFHAQSGRRPHLVAATDKIRPAGDFANINALLLMIVLASLLLLSSTGCSALGIRTTEEASHSVIKEDGPFELRQYDELVLAETSVDAAYDEAGEIAFERLFGYISGDNVARSEIAMTAPVLAEAQEESKSVEVSMTAPVLAEGDSNSWRVAFVLPASFTQETAPEPTNPLVALATVPAKLVATVRFSGNLREREMREREQELLEWIDQNGLVPSSAPRSAGYDPPWTPPFLRRNEVMIDVERDG